MGTKALISSTLSGAIAAGAVTFEITDPSQGKTLKIDGVTVADALNVVRHNYAGNGWVPVTSGGREVQLSSGQRTATLLEVGTYSVEGYLNGTRTLWTEVIS